MGPKGYRISVSGRLTERLGSAFEGMALEPGNGQTAPVGEIRGVLGKIRNLGLELVSVEAVPETSRSNEQEWSQ